MATPMNFVSHHNTCSDRELSTFRLRQLRLRDAFLDARVNGAAPAVVHFRESHNGSIGNRIARAITDRVCLDENAIFGRLSAHPQVAWIGRSDLHDAANIVVVEAGGELGCPAWRPESRIT